MTLTIDQTELKKALCITAKSPQASVSITAPIRFQRRGVESKIVIVGPDADNISIDKNLCRLIGQARFWFDQLVTGKVSSVREISRRDRVNENEITRTLPLAFLSPQIVEDILKGKQAQNLTAYGLKRLSALPMNWADQAKLLSNHI